MICFLALAPLGLTARDIAEAVVKHQRTSPHNGVTDVSFQQQLDGIDVFAGVTKVNIAGFAPLSIAAASAAPSAGMIPRCTAAAFCPGLSIGRRRRNGRNDVIQLR